MSENSYGSSFRNTRGSGEDSQPSSPRRPAPAPQREREPRDENESPELKRLRKEVADLQAAVTKAEREDTEMQRLQDQKAQLQKKLNDLKNK